MTTSNESDRPSELDSRGQLSQDEGLGGDAQPLSQPLPIDELSKQEQCFARAFAEADLEIAQPL